MELEDWEEPEDPVTIAVIYAYLLCANGFYLGRLLQQDEDARPGCCPRVSC